MEAIGDRIVDANGDGHADDVAARIVVDPPFGEADRGFWSTLLDRTAELGLRLSALPLPLVVTDRARVPPGVEAIVVRGLDDLGSRDDGEDGNDPPFAPTSTGPNPCLTRFFTADGALEDRDGDLLPDATRIAFDLPATLPAELGAALANLAARIGLESGGITLPLVHDRGAPFRVRPGAGPAFLRATAGGWRAEGNPADLARLLERVAADWPHLGAPETGGAAAGVATLTRWLAGDGPEPREAGEVVWERDWEAAWEVERVLTAVRAELPALAAAYPTRPLDVTLFVSEPVEVRRDLADRLSAELAEAGCDGARVAVLSAFKAGLSWLREVVIPAARDRGVARLRVTYRRYGGDADIPPLDLPIRWLQELFPGNALAATALGVPLEAVEIVEAADTLGPIYTAEAFDANGVSLDRWFCSPLWREQPWIAAAPDAGSVCVTTGGFRVGGRAARAARARTDLEQFWAFWQEEVLPRVTAGIDERGAAAQPIFSELLAEVWISEPNDGLGVREENASAAEALAEEIYFTTLDAIELLGKRRTGERWNAPGAIIPIVHVAPGEPPRARVTLRAAPTRRHLPRPELRVIALRLDGDDLVADLTAETDGDAAPTLARLTELATRPAPDGPTLAVHVRLAGEAVRLRLPLPATLDPLPAPGPPPMDENIWGEAVVDHARRLASFPEVTAWEEDRSYGGRPVVALALAAPAPGRLRSPTKEAILKPTFLIIARHHANEISSTNAAFQLAWRCATDHAWRRFLDRLNVLILPYANPDGAALHVRLAAESGAETWKHHAARYNALGLEFGEECFAPQTRFGEARARLGVWRRWPADVVVDDHGVPSHEWVQPFAGFGSPPRFPVSYWIVQAMLYGIARWVDDPAHPERSAAARAAVEALRDAVSAKLRATDIGDWNRVYYESYRFWGQDRLPERFPGTVHDGMLWHIGPLPPDPAGRDFAARYPQTTALSWVTEAADETATGEHLERAARAHLLANEATLELLAAAAPPVRRWRLDDGDDRFTLRVGRPRPLAIIPTAAGETDAQPAH